MKNYLLTVLLMSVLFNLMSQPFFSTKVVEDQVPMDVLKWFYSKNPGAVVTEWTKHENDEMVEYSAKMIVDGKAVVQRYTPKGKLVMIAENMDKDSLSPTIVSQIKRNYPEAKILEFTRMEWKDTQEVVHKAKIKNGKETIALEMDENMNLLTGLSDLKIKVAYYSEN